MATYDKNIDYASEIKKAVNQGDNALVGQLMQQRQAKMSGEGLDNKGNKIATTQPLNQPTQPAQPRLESDIYALQEKQRLQALERAKQSGLANLDAEQKNINPAFNTALSDLGGQSALGARNLQEYLAQRGQTNSGISAQAEINRQGNLNTGMANLEQQRAGSLSDIERRRSEVLGAYDHGALQSALQSQIDRYQGDKEREAFNRQEFLNTIGAYGGDYAAQINAIQGDGDPSNDWQIPYLQQARQQKLSGIAQSQAEAEQQAFENYMKQLEVEYKIGKPYYNPNTRSSGGGSSGSGSGGGGTSSTKPYGLTLAQAQSAYNNGTETPNVLKTLDHFLGTDYSAGFTENANMSFDEIRHAIGMNRTPEGMVEAAQKLVNSGANESYVMEALKRVGLY